MATEQGLYAQVVMTPQKDSENKKEKERTKKQNSQGQTSRSRRWFDLDHEWLGEKIRTHKPYLYKNFIKTFRGDYTKTYQIFGVLIVNEKTTRKVQFHPEAPVIKYHQK